MSAISSLTNPAASAVDSSQRAAADAAGTNPFGEVSSEEWLNIILEELSNQDPFEPNDTAATLEQLNSLRSIESDLSLQNQLQALVLQSSIGQAGALIGKQIEGLSNTGQPISGIVESVRVVDGQSQLQLESGLAVTFDNVTDIRNPAAGGVATTTADPAPDADAVLAQLMDQLGTLPGVESAEQQTDETL
jgi:flagellar basal-body rod modification protein FlgD